jgi:DnaJ-domain-containing protein 1
MPKIKLKPNSPEFNDSTAKPKDSARRCDMPACNREAGFRAPKDRGLNDYYWFCQEHVQEYNKAWNFFAGMSIEDMEAHIARSTIWDRPTRRYDTAGNAEAIKRKAWQTYHFTDEEPPQEKRQDRARYSGHRQTPEFDALSIMGLAPPIDLDAIKTRYKELAKKYHPDLNGADPEAEELLKKINMAYTVLKLAYQKFGALPQSV